MTSLTERQTKMLEYYRSGKTASESAKLVGFSDGKVCLRLLKRLGEPVRPSSHYHTKYVVNHQYFDVIDTEEKAYWLGFLAADGYVVDGNRIGITLKGDDVTHIEKFRVAIGSTHVISSRSRDAFGKRWRQVSFIFSSSHMAKTLTRHNIVPKKSLGVGPSELIPDELKRHYWRGVFDGDGCIHKINDGGRIRWRTTLCCNLLFADAYTKFVTSHVASSAKPFKNGNIYYISFCGERLTPAVVSLLYDGSTIHLDRKKALAEQAVSGPRGPAELSA